MHSKLWIIDEPTPFASRVEWAEFLAEIKDLHASEPHPDLAAAIERAEWALSMLGQGKLPLPDLDAILRDYRDSAASSKRPKTDDG